jgi:gluconokinase
VSGLPEGSVVFVLLDGSRELIAERLAERQNHYMNPKLLDSQLATLEPPADALRVVNDRAPEEIVDEIMQEIMA